MLTAWMYFPNPYFFFSLEDKGRNTKAALKLLHLVTGSQQKGEGNFSKVFLLDTVLWRRCLLQNSDLSLNDMSFEDMAHFLHVQHA